MRNRINVVVTAIFCLLGGHSLTVEAAPTCKPEKVSLGMNPYLPIKAGREVVNGPYPLFSSSKIHCYEDGQNLVHRYEVGTVNGLPYRLWYSYGQAAIGARPGVTFEFPMVRSESLPHTWRVRCRYDDFEEKKTCRLNTRSVGIMRRNDGQIAMRPVIRDFHRKSRWGMKVDGHQAVMSNENGQMTSNQYDELFAQFQSGKLVRIRYHNGSTPKAEAVLNLEGFNTAWKVFQRIYDRIGSSDH